MDNYMKDCFELENLLVRYTYAMDSIHEEGAVERLMALFTEDAVSEGPYGPRLVGKPELEKSTRERLVELRATTEWRHYVTNVLIDVQGDNATIKAYLMQLYRRPMYGNRTSGDIQLTEQVNGDYQFDARRENGEWRLCRRVLHLIPTGRF
jgi:hypothetical protein